MKLSTVTSSKRLVSSTQVQFLKLKLATQLSEQVTQQTTLTQRTKPKKVLTTRLKLSARTKRAIRLNSVNTRLNKRLNLLKVETVLVVQSQEHNLAPIYLV